jgi:hypothetical protein
MSITSKVRQTVVLTADGNLQSLVYNSLADTSTATNIKQINIMNIFGMATAADAEIKIYNETGSATAKNLVFHGKFGSADNAVHEFKLPGAGIYCNDGAYVDLTNCDFCYVIGTF